MGSRCVGAIRCRCCRRGAQDGEKDKHDDDARSHLAHGVEGCQVEAAVGSWVVFRGILSGVG